MQELLIYHINENNNYVIIELIIEKKEETR